MMPCQNPWKNPGIDVTAFCCKYDAESAQLEIKKQEIPIRAKPIMFFSFMCLFLFRFYIGHDHVLDRMCIRFSQSSSQIYDVQSNVTVDEAFVKHISSFKNYTVSDFLPFHISTMVNGNGSVIGFAFPATK